LTILLLGVAAETKAQVLLEDFASLRKNGMGTDLWAAYLGEDPLQTYSLEDGMFKDVVGLPPNGVYMHFFPNTGFGYPFPDGYAQHWIKSGTWDPNANRLRFRVKCSADVPRRADGGDILQIGTYIKYHPNPDTASQGAHYYHLLDPNFFANRWMLIEINRVPQHQVGQNPYINWPEDPQWNSSNPVHYFDGLTRFYFDTQGSGWSNQTCHFDDFQFDTVNGEPDSYVSSTAATHNGTAYEVSWAAPKNSVTTYEVRYSTTSSLKVAGFSSGTDGGTVSSPGSAYVGTIWKSPAMPEASSMYVAIRPVGQSLFTEITIPAMSTQSPASPCDLNSDGLVDQVDVQLAKDAVLGAKPCTGDLDQNGRCDVIDLQRVTTAVLGGVCKVGP